ncbi:TolB family protein [Oceanirhabdus sp. W0125-5]|uniref:TolB family protein n=1 Tax=Oceanirhabdus sp. W0125-5 TaxID=2999116 RepID=UPI0022F2EF8F|nr:hypothetical protein [Oceanirhabdus sp. W0125-5]WBW96518.1 hypothetical protein OW730_22915 [Oceanirhabdus sp. W0125-5]
MNKRNLIIGTLVISALAGVGGYATYRAEGQENNKKITIIKDTNDIMATEVAASKVDSYEGITGYDWLNEKQIVITKENESLEQIKIISSKLKANFNVKNLYLFDLNSKEEKGIGDQSKSQDGAIFSPNKEYMFYRNEFEKSATAYIADSKGNTKAEILDSVIHEYDLSEAQWINDKEVIIPCHSIKGFAVINIDGTISKIEDVEEGIMGTEDPLKGLSITKPMKVGDKIYYVTIHRGSDDDDKIKVYDINNKEYRILVKDDVHEFSSSPDQSKFLMVTANIDKDVNELIITDLEGKQRELLAEGYIFGARWSPDGTKIAYISYGEGKEGLYLVDVKTKKKSLISAGEYYLPISWSPSGEKLMVHSTKPKDKDRPFDVMGVTNVITLK